MGRKRRIVRRPGSILCERLPRAVTTASRKESSAVAPAFGGTAGGVPRGRGHRERAARQGAGTSGRDPTREEVARTAGVSRAAVSRVAGGAVGHLWARATHPVVPAAGERLYGFPVALASAGISEAPAIEGNVTVDSGAAAVTRPLIEHPAGRPRRWHVCWWSTSRAHVRDPPRSPSTPNRWAANSGRELRSPSGPSGPSGRRRNGAVGPPDRCPPRKQRTLGRGSRPSVLCG